MRPKIAALCTIYFPMSHADVIVTRWLDPHPNDAREGFVPQSDIAALFVAQTPHSAQQPDAAFRVAPRERDPQFDQRYDISRIVAQRYGVPLFGSVREALCLGGTRLAVDGVLLIGEHGEYPSNEWGQILYPRKELFDEIVAVFRASGRAVPVFVDKHLSWNMDWAREMLATARELGFALMAGSSIPLAGPAEDLALPLRPQLSEALGLFYHTPEVYGFHSLEYVQSIIERRAGGESGIRTLQVWQGEDVWGAIDNGAIPGDLLAAALAATQTPAGDYRANCRASGVAPFAARLEHVDGLLSYHVRLDGHVSDFVVALRLRDDARLRASGVRYVPADSFVRTFAVLDREIQRMLLEGRSPVPIERNVLTTLTTASWMQALVRQPGRSVSTPQLELAYTAM